jgi:hypothetical protein
MGMVNIEPELRCPAPRQARLRMGARRRFAVALALFIGLGGAPLIHVARHLWAFQTLQRDGRPVPATVLRRSEQRIAGMWWGTLQCVYASPSGPTATATLPVDHSWWVASPPGSAVMITTCPSVPGLAALGGPSRLQLNAELGFSGYAVLAFGLLSLLFFGARLRPYFRDLTLVSLGTPVAGRVVGKTWRKGRRLGRTVALWMIHLHFRDPYGVERVRTQIVDGDAWAHVTEGESMTVLVSCRRRGWFAAYSLLLAEAVQPVGQPAAVLRSERT